MTLEQFQERVDVVVNDILTVKLPDWFSMIVATDVIAGVEKRITETGTLASGKKPTYSTKPSLVGYPPADALPGYAKMYKEAYTKLKANKNTEWVTIKKGGKSSKLMVNEGGYKWMKENIQERTGIVDLYVSGNMLGSVRVKKVNVNGLKLVVTYGPNGSEEEKKVESHNDRYNENVLMPNAQEILSMKNRVEKQIIKYLNAGLFGK